MQEIQGLGAFHNAGDTGLDLRHRPGHGFQAPPGVETFSYEFENFFHPFVAQLIKQAQPDLGGRDARPGIPGQPGPDLYIRHTRRPDHGQRPLLRAFPPNVAIDPGAIDVSFGGPYANYNWELLYHIPVMVAVHLSNNQRFAEAQKWFHLVFDPTSTDTKVPTPERFWKSFVFRGDAPIQNINTLITLLSRHRPGAGKGQGRSHHRLQRASWPIRSSRTSWRAAGRAPTSGTS